MVEASVYEDSILLLISSQESAYSYSMMIEFKYLETLHVENPKIVEFKNFSLVENIQGY